MTRLFREKPSVEGPIHLMRMHNDNGVGYWLEDIRLVSGVIRQADVTHIGSNWIEVRELGATRATWINFDHIISLNIVEG